MKKRFFGIYIGFVILFACQIAGAGLKEFKKDSLIIPMDITYQDDGMFMAYGLVYQLLYNDVTVYWAIDSTKTNLATPDFTASAVDIVTDDVITDYGYVAGPFVIDAADADKALTIIESWQTEHSEVVVHKATGAFFADVDKEMTAAPTIAIYADGNEDIAFSYLNAAGIPDSLGNPWPAAKDKTLLYPDNPDVLSVEEVRGPDGAINNDGALFDSKGLPVYCEMMSMHLDEKERLSDPHVDEAIGEIREFLQFPTHFFAECQAVNTIENSINGHFLTTEGFLMDDKPDAVEVISPYLPFNQFDGDFEPVGGSEPSYTLRDEDSDSVAGTYHDDGVVMLSALEANGDSTAIGYRDVWMTGYVDGICKMPVILLNKGTGAECDQGVGKVSYLGGHKYSVKTPVSTNPDSQGTRLFLNALFEADCVIALGQPSMNLYIEVPEFDKPGTYEIVVTYQNDGFGVSNDVVVNVILPDGATLDSSSLDPDSEVNNMLTWLIGNMAPKSSGEITLMVTVDDESGFDINGNVIYKIGQNDNTVNGDVVPPGSVDLSVDTDSAGETSLGDSETFQNGSDTDSVDTSGDTDSDGSKGSGSDDGGCGCSQSGKSVYGTLFSLIL